MTSPGTLPLGQIETQRFPVVGERAPSSDIESWSLDIVGHVTEPITLSFTDFLALDHSELVFDIHCVTSWTRFDSSFVGVPLSSVLEPTIVSGFVSFIAFSNRRHHTSLPIDVAMEQSWLVHEFDGEPLSVEHGGPVRVVTPGKYFYKSLKWVKSIDVLTEDRLGWWETDSSYHNNADPWAGDQRFVTGSLRPEQLERFLSATRYDKYRGRVLLGLDLRSWNPAVSDLRRLYLKNCNLSGVDLSDSDLRGANLSLSSLVDSNLKNVNLAGSDLEGANFTGADLSGADLSGCALSAARFDGAKVQEASFEASWGLVEDQDAYLAGQGAIVPSILRGRDD